MNYPKFWYVRDELRLLFVAVIVGISAGGAASGFYWLLNTFVDLFLLHRPQNQGAVLNAIIILSPAVGGLICGILVHHFSPDSRGGVGEVIDAIIHRNGKIRGRVAVVKALASAICIGSGGSAGREGPVVQIGGSVASTLNKFFSIKTVRAKSVVACGVAAGISAVFNAPIAGALFAAEIITGKFESGEMILLFTSSAVGATVSRVLLHDHTSFEIPSYHLSSHWEVVFSLLVGILCAIFSEVFSFSYHSIEEFFSKLKLPAIAKPALGGLVVGIIGFWIPEVFGTGVETLQKMFSSPIPPLVLATFLVGKILATSVTLGSGGSGGDLMPSLFLGGAVGGIFGYGLQYIAPFQTMPHGAYAVIGAAALFGGVSRAPLTSVALGFEMGLSHGLILPLLTATAFSVLFASFIKNQSMYTFKLHKKGVDVFKIRKQHGDPLHQVLVREVMRPGVEHNSSQDEFLLKSNIPHCYQDEKLDEVLLRMEATELDKFWVMESRSVDNVVGVLFKLDLLKAYPLGRERLGQF